MSDPEEQRPLISRNPNWNRRPYVNQKLSSTRRTPSARETERPVPHRRNDGSNIFQNYQNGQDLSPPIISQSSESSLRFACTAILIAVTFERISFYGLTGNLVLFLNKDPFLWESYHAMNALMMFFGLTFIMSPIGGWIADSFLGRFKTMLVALAIYLCGFSLLPLLAGNSPSGYSDGSPLPDMCGNSTYYDPDSPFTERCSWLIFIILFIIAIGNGILKSNIAPFGSDQLYGRSQHTQLSFFNWFYWCINMGSFIGLGVIAFIEQRFDFKTGFIACAATLCAAALIFITGSCSYVFRPPDGSVLTNIFRIIGEAWRRKRQHKQILAIRRETDTEEGSSSDVDEASVHLEKISFLDYAKHRHGGIFHNSLVDDVKKLKMILAVFAVLIPYWIVYFQMQTTFLFQGLHMKLDFTPSEPMTNISLFQENHLEVPIQNTTMPVKPEIAAAWLSLCDAIFVIILLPLFDRVIYPRMRRAGYPFTFLKRVTLGMVFAMAAMFVAGVVEHYRLKRFWPYDDASPPQLCKSHAVIQVIGNTSYEAADMSIFWQIPQYALIGTSEVFTSVACLQFAVSVAPRSMKAIITGLFYFFSGLGSLIGTCILISLSSTHTWFSKWDSGNINCRYPCSNPPRSADNPQHYCHLDYYFFMLGGLQGVALVLFIIVAKTFKLSAEELTQQNLNREPAAVRHRSHIQRRGVSDTSVESVAS